MTDQRAHELSPDPVDVMVDEVVQDVRRGARRASVAIRTAVAEGAGAIDDALHPTLLEQISELGVTMRDHPSETLEVVRRIIRDRPILSVTSIALASLALYRVSRKFGAR